MSGSAISGLTLTQPGGATGMRETGTREAGLFDLAERKLGWIDTRQKQLAQNIANADTPGYKPRDLKPFSAVLDQVGLAPVSTSPLHLAGSSIFLPGARPEAGETAPDGNAVSVEKEMTKVADDETQQQFVGNVWKSYMGMFMTALGKGG